MVTKKRRLVYTLEYVDLCPYHIEDLYRDGHDWPMMTMRVPSAKKRRSICRCLSFTAEIAVAALRC